MKIGFTTEGSGSNLPLEECASWMHWKSLTISGDISGSSQKDVIKDIDIIKGIMGHGYYIGSESKMQLEFGLY
ncbi:MAG: hypothetical protein AAGF85_11800 [Bacteroidota bacterium]